MTNQSKGFLAALILGSITFLSIFGYIFSQYFFSKGIKLIKSNNIKADDKLKTVDKFPLQQNDNDVEEEEDEEEEEEEEIESDSEKDKKLLEEYKSKYEDATRLARKYLDGHQYIKAADKFTEAIDLASHLPSASKDILTLYNNRSAMYEKAKEYQKSLSDITVVLAMDVKHLKARARRARIYEDQGKLREALYDYIFVLILEQLSQVQQPTSLQKADELCKRLSRDDATKLLNEIRVNTDRSLPSKSYCKSFFEALPDIHIWREKFKDTAVEGLIKSFHEEKTLDSGLNLITYYISKNVFTKAFDEVLPNLPAYLTNGSPCSDEDVSLYYDLIGTNAHLRCGFNAAIEGYKSAISYNESNYQTKLKLASVYVEIGENNEAEKIFDSLLENFQSSLTDSLPSEEHKIGLAYFYLHRANLWTSKDENGKLPEGGIEKSLSDVSQVLSLTENLISNNVAKEARIAALLKLVQITTHSKSQIGQQATEEDLALNRKSINEAKSLSPNNITTLLLDADLSALEGNLTSAIDKIDDIISKNGDSDSLPYVIKANLLTQKAFQLMQESSVELSQRTFEESVSFYNKCLSIEPNSIEALTQLSQLKQMFGDIDASVELAEKSLKLGRNRDELQEICQLYNNAKAQKAAIEVIRPGM